MIKMEVKKKRSEFGDERKGTDIIPKFAWLSVGAGVVPLQQQELSHSKNI